MSYFLTDGSCSCHTGHPPCSFCTDTFECDSCMERQMWEEGITETEQGFLCMHCECELNKISSLETLGLIGEEMILFLIMMAYGATLFDLTLYFMSIYYAN